jgi:hypothetical protein
MNYNEMSDYEINRAVAAYWIPASYEPCEEVEEVHKIDANGSIYGVFDPCNDPIDAWAIVVCWAITIAHPFNSEPFVFGEHVGGFFHPEPSGNTLRDCMICYLIMKESE